MAHPEGGEDTRTAAVMRAIRVSIANRAIQPDDRLPSIRRFAATMGVSPSTVVEAYDRLVAEGIVRAKPGSGFYVSATAMPPLALTEHKPARDLAIDPFWVSRQSLDAEPDALRPGCGWLPPDWMPIDALRRALRATARADAALLTDYGPTRGSLALRRALTVRLAADRVEAAPEQILLTASGTQAIDLVCRFLLRPGDTVIVDDPCYFNFRALLRAHQARIVSVPYTPSGPDVAAFETLLTSERPKLYITNSALHNPTGATLSTPVAHRLLNVASAHDITIVEDDIFADFEPDPSVRLATLDGMSRVIRIGSFSKTLSASIQCGYIATRPDWIEHLADLQIATRFGGPSPVAVEVIAAVLASGNYRKHVETLRRRLAQTMRKTAADLLECGIEPWLTPRGGCFLWCRLPEDCDAVDVARHALIENVVLAPGNVFSASQSHAKFMRFNVAQCQDARIMPALRRAIGNARGRKPEP